MEVGTKVGARRWPYHCNHVDCWQKPWSGIVLAKDDPRAWVGTAAFGFTDNPDPEAVKKYVKRCESELLSDFSQIPVLWDFGDRGQKVYWENPKSLRPYDEDVAEWEKERAMRQAS